MTYQLNKPNQGASIFFPSTVQRTLACERKSEECKKEWKGGKLSTRHSSNSVSRPHEIIFTVSFF